MTLDIINERYMAEIHGAHRCRLSARSLTAIQQLLDGQTVNISTVSLREDTLLIIEDVSGKKVQKHTIIGKATRTQGWTENTFGTLVSGEPIHTLDASKASYIYSQHRTSVR